MSSKFESLTGKTDYPFEEYTTPPREPITLAQKWLQEAIHLKVKEPRAMVLTTINASNTMSSRVMAILEFADNGVIINTHSCSRKINDTHDNPTGCGHFYWRELGRQLSVSGKIHKLERERAITEWNKRPPQLHSMSVASHQSQPLLSYEELLSKASALEKQVPLPCPERYSIHALIPDVIEFWSSSANRLHKRLRYELAASTWTITRLQP